MVRRARYYGASMSLWVAPAVVAAVGLLPLLVALGKAKAEVQALRVELAQLAVLRGAVQALGPEVGQLQREVTRRRTRRPGAEPAP